jgi:tetrapyrrole methylase family protein/MazG family protein
MIEIEACLAALNLELESGVVLQNASVLADSYHPPFSPNQHVLLFDLQDPKSLGRLVQNLRSQYQENHLITILRNAGHPQEQSEVTALNDLLKVDALSAISCIYLPPVSQESAFQQLQRTVAHLRAPEGCPWDRDQTHESLRTHILEETYETLAAIDAEDPAALAEELGDLLLQIVMQVQIAVEIGDFYMADVIAGINNKLVRRHPHVFDGLQVSGVEEVLQNWDELKAAERADHEAKHDSLGGVPRALPALAQANELQVRAARAGFDWPNQDGVITKLVEEIQELQESENNAAEFGDLLFTLVNFSRWMGIDAEGELRKANLKFRMRFDRMFQHILKEGKSLSNLSIPELDGYWETAKREIDP